MRKYASFLFVVLILTIAFNAAAAEKGPLVGQTEMTYKLAGDNQDIRGLAFDDVSPARPRLLVLDGSGKIFVYKPVQDGQKGIDELRLQGTIDLPKDSEGKLLAGPRGLAFAMERSQGVIYFLNWDDSGEGVTSELWRFKPEAKEAAPVNLSLYTIRIGDRELLDVAYDNGNIFVSFDGSGYDDLSYRVHRGIIQLRWNQAHEGKLDFIKHLPDSGHMPSRGLAAMTMDGARYLWGTVGGDHVYCAHLPTGRGLFFFDLPRSSENQAPFWGLAFGGEALWVAEPTDGPDWIHRVNVTKNLDEFYEGPHILRHLSMSIRTEPEGEYTEPGKVYHNYSRPYAYDQLHNQGVWPETEKYSDLTGVPNAKLKPFTYDPAGDVSSRQHMVSVEYENAPAQAYSSKYEIDIWTNDYRKFVYPHRVDKDTSALEGLNYLEDDPCLFNLEDKRTYDDFFDRVREHIMEKYGVPADLEHPYWAARNVLEYIQDHYYYPGRDKRKPAMVDYDRAHYDANPGNLKIDLSRNEYDKNQIIACSGTSVMITGAMRYLGIPARWLGTGTEYDPKTWDSNGNGLLDENETAGVSSGHRYTQVWLGRNYGWICFDGTPTRPEFNDYDPPPPIRSQWRYMNRAARGHLKDKRIVFNVGSRKFLPLFREFEYDEKLAIDNNCGGDQRYNLQGRFDEPKLWKLPRHRIAVENLCFIEGVSLEGPREETKISWSLKGSWDRDPGAKVDVYLQKIHPEKKKHKDIGVLAEGVSPQAGVVTVDLSAYSGENLRVIIRKVGDPETGGHSDLFDLK